MRWGVRGGVLEGGVRELCEGCVRGSVRGCERGVRGV